MKKNIDICIEISSNMYVAFDVPMNEYQSGNAKKKVTSKCFTYQKVHIYFDLPFKSFMRSFTVQLLLAIHRFTIEFKRKKKMFCPKHFFTKFILHLT